MRIANLTPLRWSAAVAMLATLAGGSAGRLAAQPPPAPAAPAAPANAKSAARFDLTGYWVSLVTEDWIYRMVTPKKGDFASVPLNPAGRTAATAWDPAKDESAGEQCKSYGAPAIMRVPGRLHITWADNNSLQIDTDSGNQTRLFHFRPAAAQNGESTWQGYSVAQWQRPGEDGMRRLGPGDGRRGPDIPGGTLRVTTTHLRPGYLRKNGVPYSANTVVTEYYNRTNEPNGDSYLIVTTIVEDPQYLRQPFVTSSHFKYVASASGWDPMPCTAR